MLPIVLDVKSLAVAVVGGGPQSLKRLDMLDGAGAEGVRVYAENPSPELAAAAGARLVRRLPTDEELSWAAVTFIGDMERPEAEAIAGRARAQGRLVNTEDVTPLCDFHVPAMVRRGDLLITVSTNGRSPALAKRVRGFIERAFGPEWAQRLDELGALRDRWRMEGEGARTVIEKTDAIVSERRWLP